MFKQVKKQGSRFLVWKHKVSKTRILLGFAPKGVDLTKEYPFYLTHEYPSPIKDEKFFYCGKWMLIRNLSTNDILRDLGLM